MRILVLISALLFLSPGCKDKDVPPENPVDTTSAIGHYGSGSLSFLASGGGGPFSVSGKYKPSNLFLTDSISEGAGGFVHDTTFFQKNVGVMMTGYFHHLIHGALDERWIVITLHAGSGAVLAGDYPFAPSNAAQASQAAYAYFFYSDTVSFNHEVFIPKSGTLTLSSFNHTTRHLQGSFTGTLWGLPPDTAFQIDIANGLFDLTCVPSYYIP